MRKRLIRTIAIVMTLAFVGLLALQITYVFDTSESIEREFNENVGRSLFHVARTLEESEVQHYLDVTADEYSERKARKAKQMQQEASSAPLPVEVISWRYHRPQQDDLCTASRTAGRREPVPENLPAVVR
jgi:hypothetical protein